MLTFSNNGNKKISHRKVYIVGYLVYSMVKQITLRFDEKDFKKLENEKEAKKIIGECSNWEDFILKVVGVRK